jgi:aromatic ring-opening dioxygenase LigB subunit
MIDDTVIIAFISLAGTILGTFGGIITSSRLTGYRLEQLEKKVEKSLEKHNGLVERVFRLEEGEKLLTEKVSVANHRIDDLEKITSKA